MEIILQRFRTLVAGMTAGACGFLFFGYLAKMFPALMGGAWVLFGVLNLFLLYIFVFYEDYRELVLVAIVVQILAGLLLWI